MKKFLLFYFLLLSTFFIFISSGVVDSIDGFSYLAVARNIYYKGEPTAQPPEYDTKQNIYMNEYTGKNGKPYTLTGLGYSIALLPSVALTDLSYKYYHLNPPIHFPLESDWLILLLASFTNSFFAASLGVILFAYFLSLNLSKKQALFLSLTSLFTTNLFVYGKHSFAHIMFINFLVLAFFLLKKYSQSKNKKFLIFSGLSYGLTAITYNQTFLLSLIPYLAYYLLLTKPKLIQTGAQDLFAFLMGLAPFIMVYLWFENTRTMQVQSLASPSFFTTYASNSILKTPIPVLLEGLYGQLLSPGRSIFIYTPLLIVPLVFWHRIRLRIKPELITFLILSFIYILFYATVFSTGRLDQGVTGLWHGESSWGPRYLTPLIPFGMLIIGHIFQELSHKEKLLVFYPLMAIGLYVEMLGILIPYQIKFYNLEPKFTLNGTEYTSAVYSDLLPRYSPIYSMSKDLVKLGTNLPKTLNHGTYNVKFYDGIDFPFNVGPERWRVIEGTGYISFDNKPNQPIQKMAFGVINHPVGESSSSARLQFILNNHPLLSQPETLSLRERKLIEIPIKNNYLLPANNRLAIQIQYDDPKVFQNHSQILGLINYSINNHPINLESLDFPYVSPLGPKMTGVIYQDYGGTNKNPWKTWDIHTQIFERVPDFWWVKALYYWDLPKPLFLGIFVTNLSALLYFGRKVYLLGKKF